MIKSKKRVLIVLDQISPSTGGYWTVLDIIKSLSKTHNVSVCIAGVNYPNSIFILRKNIKEYCKDVSLLVDPFISRLGTKSFFQRLKNLLLIIPYKFLLKFIFLYQRIQKHRIFKSADIIFLSSFIPLNNIKKLRNNYTKAEIIQNHAGSTHTIKEFTVSINKEGSISDMYKCYLELVDKILFQSNSQKEDFAREYKDLASKSFAILPSVNEKELIRQNLAETPFNTDNFNIVYVATVQKRKMQDLCVEIAYLIKKLGRKIKLYFIGEHFSDEYYLKLINFINEKELQDVIFFLGYREDYANYMWKCDLIIHPSSAEGVPRVLREAMYMGKAVLASNLPGNKDILLPYGSGILADKQKPEIYCEHIIKIMDESSIKFDYEEKARIGYDSLLSSKKYRNNIRNFF